MRIFRGCDSAPPKVSEDNLAVSHESGPQSQSMAFDGKPKSTSGLPSL